VSKTAAVVLAFLTVMLFVIPSSAQLLPNGNVYAGVSYGQFENAGVNKQSYHGWNASAEAIPFARFSHLGVVLDASGFYRKGLNGGLITQYNFLLGPRLSVTMGKWRPFVHAMGGLQRVTSSGYTYNPIAIDVGGGVDYKIFFKNFSWRVQGDYVRSRYAGANNNAYRASTGIVWRF
jgi:hypothetical protein